MATNFILASQEILTVPPRVRFQVSLTYDLVGSYFKPPHGMPW
ncbi:MAG: hypothetical protein AABY61_03830 [Nitrospirota bacterium]|jgi:hypothetical protein